MKTFRLLSFLLVAGLFVGACGDRKEVKEALIPAERTVIPAERIAHAYHGMLLDRDLKEIKLDTSLITEIQDSMIDDLLKASDDGTRKHAAALVKEVLSTEKLDGDTTILVKNGIVGRLLDQAPETLKAKYDWRYRLIRSGSWHLIDSSIVLKLRPEILELLRSRGIFDHIFQQRDESSYLADCRAQNVPIPPDWGNPQWIFRGDLEPQYDFLSGGGTKVYTYNDSKGVCFALPRSSSGLMGIICQSESTGKACFFDNIDSRTGRRVDWRTSPVIIANLQNGSNLAENCTECHRGKNAFLIHPRSALDVPIDINPSIRYSPIGQSTWANPGPLFSPPGTACYTCHEIPVPSRSYCDVVLARAARMTMPPGSTPVGWPASSGSPYSANATLLRAYCLYIGATE